MSTASTAQLRTSLIRTLVRLGYPEEFGVTVADTLKTEFAMTRMLSYLIQFRPAQPEDVVDEMLSIQDLVRTIREKKIAEYHNRKYNEYLNSGLSDEGDGI